MNIRAYEDSDLPRVARLFTESVHQVAASHYNAVQRAVWAPQPPDLDHWRKRLEPLHTLVAYANDSLAGFLSYELDGHIDILFTAPEFTRQGVATGLYDRAELGLVALGVTEIYTEASLVARPFFERQGFRVVEEQTVTKREVSFLRFAMRKWFVANR